MNAICGGTGRDSGTDAADYFQHFFVAGYLPLLAAQIGIADGALAVQHEEGRALAQGEEGAFDLVPVIDLACGIGQAIEGDVVLLKIVPGRLLRVPDQGNNLSPGFAELFIVCRQPTEVPAAERSHKTTQKDQHNAGDAAVA